MYSHDSKVQNLGKPRNEKMAREKAAKNTAGGSGSHLCSSTPVLLSKLPSAEAVLRQGHCAMVSQQFLCSCSSIAPQLLQQISSKGVSLERGGCGQPTGAHLGTQGLGTAW